MGKRKGLPDRFLKLCQSQGEQRIRVSLSLAVNLLC